jgi:hypothetical protein
MHRISMILPSSVLARSRGVLSIIGSSRLVVLGVEDILNTSSKSDDSGGKSVAFNALTCIDPSGKAMIVYMVLLNEADLMSRIVLEPGLETGSHHA